MKWGLWSTTASSNSATPPDGWPEGQLPSTVNDCAREMMAQIRTGINNIQFIDLGVTPTETGNTTFTMAGNQMQWFAYGNRVQANVGGTLYYGTVISSSYTSNTGVTLRFDAGNAPLTNSLSAVAVGFPSSVNGALPESVYRQKNMLMNPVMDLWERGSGPYGLSGGAILQYTADRWLVTGSLTSGASLNVSRFERSANASNVPTVAQVGQLLTSALGISVSAAFTTVNTGSYLMLEQRIEGFNYRQHAQKPMAMSMWVNSNHTGTYCIAFRNAGFDHACVQQFSISSVSTWEKKTFSIPKPPSSGTWDYSTGIGLVVDIVLVAGSTFQGGAGNWTATNIVATSSQTNFMASAGNVFACTALKLEEGTQCNPLEPIDYWMEKERCARYGRSIPVGTYSLATGFQSNGVALNLYLNPPLRAGSASLTWAATSQYTIQTTNGGTYSVSAVGVGGSGGNGIGNMTINFNAVGNPIAVGGVYNIIFNSPIFMDTEL